MRNDRDCHYPRRRRTVDIAHFRRRPAALYERSRRDLITVVRAGRPVLVLMRCGWFRDLKARAGEPIPRVMRSRTVGRKERRSKAQRSGSTA